jgi:signal transduction histidine kinase
MESAAPALFAPSGRAEHRAVATADRPGASGPHGVQFYESDEFLASVVAEFVSAGLDVGDVVILIANEAHRQLFREQLILDRPDVDGAVATGRLVMLDARETLAQFTVDRMPDWARFRRHIIGLLDVVRSAHPGASVRAYGEMVNLLWQDGQPAAALQLEAFWNDLGREQVFQLLCGYAMQNFADGDQRAGFADVCSSHTHVSPTEQYDQAADPNALLAEVSILQQKARLLEGEIDRRQRLEVALQQALERQHEVERELRASQEELRRQNEDLSRTIRFSETFVGILGHDLRNPLSGITTAAALLARRADSDRVSRPATRILNSGRRMARMIDQLLDFTRIRLGRGLPLERKVIDLAEVCRLVIDEIDDVGSLPAIDLSALGDVVGAWDADRLSQLISNLLGNALAHGDGAGVQIRIDGTHAARVDLTILNAGCIPAEVQAVMFEPFKHPGDRKQERSSGLGLGLYISQQIVFAHAGSIDVASSIATGTRITVRLPRTVAKAEASFPMSLPEAS